MSSLLKLNSSMNTTKLPQFRNHEFRRVHLVHKNSKAKSGFALYLKGTFEYENKISSFRALLISNGNTSLSSCFSAYKALKIRLTVIKVPDIKSVYFLTIYSIQFLRSIHIFLSTNSCWNWATPIRLNFLSKYETLFLSTLVSLSICESLSPCTK